MTAVGSIRSFPQAVREIWGRRELLGMLVRRELKARYRDSSLGALWSLIRPLTMLLIYYVAIGKFLGAERSIPQFAIFVFTGLTVWQLFNEIVVGATRSIVDNASLIKKIYLPREIFPLAAVGSALVNFAIMFVVLLAATLVLGQPPRLEALWTVPAGFIMLVLFSFALGLLAAALNVYFRDVQHLVEIVLLILFWASPIVYSYQQVHSILQGGWIEQVYLANPVTTVVLYFQQGMWAAGPSDGMPEGSLLRLLIAFVVSVVLLWAAQRVFARLEGNFAQEL